MSQVAMLTHITARVKQMLGASIYSTMPIAYPNQNFVQPGNSPFVSLNIKEGDSHQVNLGATVTDRATGVVQMDVYVPIESGTKKALEIAEFCKTIFRRYAVILDDDSRLHFRIPGISYIGQQGAHAGVCMRVEYWRDEPAN